MDVSSVLTVWPRVLESDFLRYALAAGPAFLFFWVWRPAWVRRRRTQPRDPGRHRILAEVGWSMSTVLTFSAVGLSISFARAAGFTRIDTASEAAGWGRVLAAVGLMVLIHDAWFYWTHRLLHSGPLLRHVHRVHHRSTSPTPWAAYAFHPLEALVQAAIFPLLVFTVPAHPRALGIFLIFMIARNVIGHLGFELLPRGFSRHALGRWHTTPTHHDLHHRHGSGNYGLYFTFWDEWMGTTRPEYHEEFDRVTSPACGLRPARVAGLSALVALTALASASAGASDGRAAEEGLWQTRDDRSGEPRALVRVSVQDGELRGRIVMLYRTRGEDPAPRCDRCRGEREGAPVVGMTILWGHRLEQDGWSQGRILDPENGREYRGRVWSSEPDRLRVRGYWGPFHRTQTWHRVPEAERR